MQWQNNGDHYKNNRIETQYFTQFLHFFLHPLFFVLFSYLHLHIKSKHAMKLIPLTHGKFAQVDDNDFFWLSKFNWYANRYRQTWYAKTAITINGDQKIFRMHRLILGLTFSDKKEIDHKDRDGLNNQRSNIWICTRKENCKNIVRPHKYKKRNQL